LILGKTEESHFESGYLHCLAYLSLDLAPSCLNFNRKVAGATATTVKPPVAGHLNSAASSADGTGWISPEQPRSTDT